MKTEDLHRQDDRQVDKRRIKRDLWGYDVHTHSNRCISLINKYYVQVLCYGRDKRVIIEAANADRSCALACALAAAYLWGLEKTEKLSPQVVVYLTAAKANWESSSAYERLVVGALLDGIAGNDEVALNSHFEVLDSYPKDLASLKRAQTLCFHMGRTSDMIRVAWQVLHMNGGSPYVYGMLSFGLLEVGSIRQAEKFARLALLIEPQDVWAQHALCHALQHQCNFKEALDFMSKQSNSWDNCCTFIYVHNWWHMAVCQLELGGCDAIDKVLAIFDNQIWGGRSGHKTSQSHIDGLGLLLRLDLRGHGITVEDRISQLADSVNESMSCPQDELLLEVLSVWALSRADHLAEATQKLKHIGSRSLALEGHEKEPWQSVTQLLTAVYEFGRANYEAVCQVMETPFNRNNFKMLGASNEQLEVFEEMWCVSHLQVGHFQRVIEVVKQRTRERPGISFNWRILEEAYSNAGQGAEAQLAATKAMALEAAANEG
ncbi:unnamed protein product [Calypogeia fissa]